MSQARFTYLDLLNPDGTRNRAAFDAILDSRVVAEINSRLCTTAGLWPPKIPLGDVRAWQAATVKLHGLGPLPNDEVRRITKEQRVALDGWVQAMQVGAERQRKAMGAQLEAAE